MSDHLETGDVEVSDHLETGDVEVSDHLETGDVEVSDHLETGDVEAVAFVSVHQSEQRLFLLHGVRRLKLVQSA